MESKPLGEWLSNTFEESDLGCIPEYFLNKLITLSEVKNLHEYILMCKEKSRNFKVAGHHRKDDWEKGWSGDGVYYSDDEYNNLPYYFKKNQYIRLNGKVFKDEVGFTELNFLRVLQLITFKKYLPQVEASSIVEYGCGTGHNLNFLRENLPSYYNFFGSDWAESATKKLVENDILSVDSIFLIDFFDKSTYNSPNNPYVAFTNASLEQTGNNYKEFIDFLSYDNLCQLGIHIEPIRELLDTSNPLNLQSYEYEEKRGYLKDFINYLKEKNVNIIIAKDFGIGSSFLSGYQVVVWSRT